MIVNVSSTHTAIVKSQLSRHDLLAWVNSTLKAEFNKVDELCTGAAYCQLMHSLYPKLVPIKRVKFCTNIEHEFIDNFKILQTIFQKLDVQKSIPIDRLVRGKFQDNIEFLQWFKTFYDANCNYELDYDPLSARSGLPMAYGSTTLKRKKKCLPTTAATAAKADDVVAQEIPNDNNIEPCCALKRSLTRTELKPNFLLQNGNCDLKASSLSSLLPTPNDHIDYACMNSVHIRPAAAAAASAQAQSKLEQIYALCVAAEASGSNSVEIQKIKEIILQQNTNDNASLVNGCFNNANTTGDGDHEFVEFIDVADDG